MYYANLGYNLRLKSDWNGNLNLDYNQNSLSGIRQDRYGIGGRLGKSFFTKKLDLAMSTQTYRGSIVQMTSDLRRRLIIASKLTGKSPNFMHFNFS